MPPSLDCDDGSYERPNQEFNEDDLSWESLSDPPVTLRASSMHLELGEEITFTLTNGGESTIESGTEARYAIQLRTEAGWQDVRVAPDDVVIRYPDLLVHHAPGDGFEWTFELTEEGLTDGYERVTVCPALRPGRYRFVYWGFDDAAVGVKFDVEAASD